MISRNQTWRTVLSTLIVALGAGVVWALAIGWGGNLISALFGRGDRLLEDLQVAADGTPVIAVQSYGSTTQVALSRRSLDGKPWPADYESWLNAAYLEPRHLPPGIVNIPLQWTGYYQRVVTGSDGKEPPTAWYVIRDAAPEGHVYFVGFDPLSKLRVGYLGKQGFRLSPPPQADQFVIPSGTQWPLSRYVMSMQFLEPNRLATYYDLYGDQRIAPWLVFIIDGQDLWEIDLRARTARVALAAPSAVSFNSLTTPEATFIAPPADSEAARGPKPRVRLAALAAQDVYSYVQILPQGATSTDKPKLEIAMAIRADDRIVIFDQPTGNHWEFALPKEVPNEALQVYWLSVDQLLIVYSQGHWAGGTINHLVWTNGAGEVARRERVELAGHVPESQQKKAWKASGIAPVPIGWVVGVLLGVPLVLLQWNDAADFTSALSQTFDVAWLPLIVVMLIGIALAWLTMRLQRKYRRPATGLWTAFVFLLGVPGFAAYWLEHRRPNVEKCGQCGEVVPRDREACAACDAPFPAPPLVGTEIFA
jgi:hypothetical protein